MVSDGYGVGVGTLQGTATSGRLRSVAVPFLEPTSNRKQS